VQVQSNGDTPELTSKQPASGNSMAAVPERGGDAADWEALPQAVLDEARIRYCCGWKDAQHFRFCCWRVDDHGHSI